MKSKLLCHITVIIALYYIFGDIYTRVNGDSFLAPYFDEYGVSFLQCNAEYYWIMFVFFVLISYFSIKYSAYAFFSTYVVYILIYKFIISIYFNKTLSGNGLVVDFTLIHTKCWIVLFSLMQIILYILYAYKKLKVTNNYDKEYPHG